MNNVCPKCRPMYLAFSEFVKAIATIHAEESLDEFLDLADEDIVTFFEYCYDAYMMLTTEELEYMDYKNFKGYVNEEYYILYEACFG